MAHSVESRVPFLDYRIMPLLFSLSENHRVYGGWSKSIIRNSMKGILPDAVNYRKDKMGFVTQSRFGLRMNSRHFIFEN